jgi:hypothetical protein
VTALHLQGMIDDGGDYHITYKLFYNDLQGRNQVPIRFLAVKGVGPCVRMPNNSNTQAACAWCSCRWMRCSMWLQRGAGRGQTCSAGVRTITRHIQVHTVQPLP